MAYLLTCVSILEIDLCIRRSYCLYITTSTANTFSPIFVAVKICRKFLRHWKLEYVSFLKIYFGEKSKEGGVKFLSELI